MDFFDKVVVQTTTDTSVEQGPLLLGQSPATVALRNDIETAARSDAKVLIVGETGVGKEIVARLIHLSGSRRRRPFVPVNCAGLPDSLLESELFGHVRGSFTGAYRDKPGLAATADGGTLFLDELGEMSPRMQGVLLRFLETGEIHRIGADRIETRVDARVIAATNRNLPARIASNEFREDLYYRLNVIHVSIPPLRERPEDILPLFNHYLGVYSRQQRIDTPALMARTEECLRGYRWPGNVREIKNVAERIAVRHTDGAIRPDMLPTEMRDVPVSVLAPLLKSNEAPAAVAPPAASLAAETAWTHMVGGGQSFWTVVHPLFINRELTKNDVRELIKRGLTQTQGSYRRLIDLFHLPQADYKRFLAFLYQHDCHVPFHPYRGGSAE